MSEESILTSIKKLLGIAEDYTQFDTDLIIHINSALSVLEQIGAGIDRCYSVIDKSTKWHVFMENNPKLDMVKSYVYLKVKLLFDPPQSSAVMEAINRTISELEWRILVATDPMENEEENQNE